VIITTGVQITTGLLDRIHAIANVIYFICVFVDCVKNALYSIEKILFLFTTYIDIELYVKAD